MADVRSLLRQQREARRINHPNAAYSDAGKLLCTLCREQVRTEALWDNHLQTPSHRQNAQRSRAAATAAIQKSTNDTNGTATGPAPVDGENASSADSGMASRPKRKLSEDEDGDEPMDDAARSKRSRAETAPDADDKNGSRRPRSTSETLSPPSLTRRTSTTPSQGVELQIPSRPATPSHKDGSSASTPGNSNSIVSAAASRLAAAAAKSTSAEASKPSSTSADVDESEWAAFEAEIAAASAPHAEDATISAPAMTAEESAAAAAGPDGDGADPSKRKMKADVDLEDEKEEATRALEDEFEEMEELEARVQRLREKRDDIFRRRRESQGQAGAAAPEKVNGVGKENVQGSAAAADTVVVEEEDEDDEDDDDDDDDDWDSFRFRGRQEITDVQEAQNVEEQFVREQIPSRPNFDRGGDASIESVRISM
ncbi:transcription factor Zn, C2H2 [Sarocladium implicatum]|nr:transcription factor Zn, C2H2 [Sarocladium implicatum]